MELTINCSQRAETEKIKALRRSGMMPGVLYGHDGTESVSLKMNTREAEALLRNVKEKEAVVTVNIPDLPWSGEAVLKEVQRHPWKNKVYHLSFFVPKTA